MILRISPNQVLIRAPAKVNLFLHVLGRRTDGYHELDSLMLPIDLYDTLKIETQPFGIQVQCVGFPHLNNKNNICAQAVQLYLKEIGWPIGVRIKIQKKIPIAAGLGGGSSDAAATLMALQHLLGSPLGGIRLQNLAARLGADVPFFLMKCPCRAQGIGEKLTPVEGLPNLWLLLACAPFELSTPKVFQQYDKNPKIPLTSGFSDDNDLPAGCRFVQLVSHLVNDLQPMSEILQPEIGRMCDELIKSGAAGASMSGSGPTVFGVFRTREAAFNARRYLKVKGWKYLVAKGITSAGRNRE